MKSCCMDKCNSLASFSCKCKPNTFVCAEHLSAHMHKTGQHLPELIAASITIEEINQIKDKVQQANQIYKIYEEFAIQAALKFIKEIELGLKQFLTQTNSLMKSNLELLEKVSKSSLVDINVLKKIEEVNLENLAEFNTDNLTKQIDFFFRINVDLGKTPDDDFLFFNTSGQCTDTLDLINLDFLTKSTLILSVPDAYSHCTSVYLGGFCYFVYGGQIYSPKTGIDSARIINIKTGTVTPQPDLSLPNCFSGSCMLGGYIYVFGGWDGNQGLSLCARFDWKNKFWETMNSMPVPSSDMSASVISGKIYVTGFHMPNVITFDEKLNSFASFYNLKEENYKYLIGNWIVAKGELVEFCEGRCIKRSKYSISVKSLITFSRFKRNNFLYFFAYPSNLFRINTVSKLLEEVQYE